MHQQMNVIVLAVALNQVRLEIMADLGKDAFQVVDRGFGQHVTPVFRNEDQMNVKHVDDMPACPILHTCAPQTK